MQPQTLGTLGVDGLLISWGALMGTLLTVVFWFRDEGDTLANRLLAAMMFVVTLNLAETAIHLAGLTPVIPHVAESTLPLLILVGPLYYFYVRRLVRADAPLPRTAWLHLAPAAFLAALYVPFYAGPVACKVQFGEILVARTAASPTPICYIVNGANLVISLGYLLASHRTVRAAAARVAAGSSDGTLLTGLDDLRRLTRAFAIYVGVLGAVLAGLLLWGKYVVVVEAAYLTMVGVFMIVNGFVAMSRPETFAHDVAFAQRPPGPPRRPGPASCLASEAPALALSAAVGDGVEAIAGGADVPSPRPRLSLAGVRASVDPGGVSGPRTDASPRGPAATDLRVLDATGRDGDRAHSNGNGDGRRSRKYERSSLSHEQATLYAHRVLDHLESERPYLDGGLRLADVSEHLGMTEHHLSQAINQVCGKNFFELINEFRVEEVKRLLVDPEKATYTVLAVGFEAGFNNKSSYNKAFKTVTGMTPSEYRRAQGVE